MHQSHLYSSLKRKYALKRFLSLTEQGKEALWNLVAITFFTLVIAYFTSHILLWLTGYYDHSATPAPLHTVSHHKPYVSPN